MSNFLEIDGVAKRFSRSVSWLYQNYKRLHREKNFPLPRKLNGYNLTWIDKEVDTWFDMQINSSYRVNDNKPTVCYEKLLAANAALL